MSEESIELSTVYALQVMGCSLSTFSHTIIVDAQTKLPVDPPGKKMESEWQTWKPTALSSFTPDENDTAPVPLSDIVGLTSLHIMRHLNSIHFIVGPCFCYSAFDKYAQWHMRARGLWLSFSAGAVETISSTTIYTVTYTPLPPTDLSWIN